MIELKPQFITDSAGKRLVVLSQNEFENILEEIEELEDIKLYDEVKRDDDGERVMLSEYILKRQASND